MYMTTNSPCGDCNTNVPPIIIGTETGHTKKSVLSYTTLLLKLPFCQGHIMPTFIHNLMGVVPLYKKV